MRSFRRLCALAWLIAASLGGHAAARTAPAPLPPGSWNVNWGDHRCSLIRRSEASPPSFFSLQTIPGSRSWEIRLVNPDWPDGALGEAEQLEVAFQPAGEVVPGRAAVERTEGGRALVFYGLPERLLDALAVSRSIRVARGGRPILEIALPAGARALAAVRECEGAVMREWGVDPATQAAVRVPPRGNLAEAVANAGYPDQALRQNLTGTVIFRMAVDAAGRVGECVTVVSSGHDLLDRRTCWIVQERARFTPALDADGNPVPAVLTSSLTWRIFGTP